MESIHIPLQSQEIVNEEEVVLEDFLSDPDIEVGPLMEDPVRLEQMILYNLPVLCFPLFELSHYIITALTLRMEFGKQFSRMSPLASCVSMLISSVAGSVMSGLLFGLPLASPLRSDLTVLTIITVWAAVSFSPEDVVFKFVSQQQVFCLLWAVKEVDRMRKIVTGINIVQEKYPGSAFLAITAGVLRGNGTTIIRPLVRTLCGVARLDNELLNPGLSTKVCFVAALAWVLTVDTTISSNVYTTAVLIFLLIRLSGILGLSRLGLTILQRLGMISINNNDPLLQTETETENQSEKKDA